MRHHGLYLPPDRRKHIGGWGEPLAKHGPLATVFIRDHGKGQRVMRLAYDQGI